MKQRYLSEKHLSPQILPGSVRDANAGDAQVPLIGQVVRLLLHLLGDVPYDALRFAERERLKRTLARLSEGIVIVQGRLQPPPESMGSRTASGRGRDPRPITNRERRQTRRRHSPGSP
jgi:hypothetical protein